jgi:hypothetical protein
VAGGRLACGVHACMLVCGALMFRGDEEARACCLLRRGAWMFAEILINFRFGKFLHYPYVLFLGEVMPNFSGDHACMCVCVSA